MKRLKDVLSVLFVIAIAMSSVPTVFAGGSTSNRFTVNFDFGKSPVEVSLSSMNPKVVQVEHLYSPQGTSGSHNVNSVSTPTKLTFDNPSNPGRLFFKVRSATEGVVDLIWNRQYCSEPPSVTITHREDTRTYVEIRNNSLNTIFHFQGSQYANSIELSPGQVERSVYNEWYGQTKLRVMPVEAGSDDGQNICVQLNWSWDPYLSGMPLTSYAFNWNDSTGLSFGVGGFTRSSVIKVDTLYGFPGGFHLESDFGMIPFGTGISRSSAYTLHGFTARLKDGDYISSVHFNSVCSLGPSIEVNTKSPPAGITTEILVRNSTRQALYLRFIPNGVNSNTIPWRVINDGSSYTFKNLPKLGRVEIVVDKSGTKSLCSYVTWNW